MSKLEIIQSFYEPKLSRDIPDFAKLGWESAEAQESRFEAFISNIDLNNKSILDVGCGLGNLLEFLEKKGIQVRYTGVDILHKMIECASDKNLKGDFHCIDIFSESPFSDESFDVVYASGIFNLNMGNNREFFSEALCRLGRMAKEAIAFNLLDYRSPDRDDTYFYFNPCEVVEQIENLECRPKKVQIIELYLNNDFTIICEK